MAAANIVLGAIKAWNNHNKQDFLATFTDKITVGLPGNVELKGKAELEKWWDNYHQAFPDNYLETHGVLSDPTTANLSCCLTTVLQGTHTGTFDYGGMFQMENKEAPPTGRRIYFQGASVYLLSDNKIDIVQEHFDRLERIAQVGVQYAIF